jgi:hypothetical protein
MQGNFGNDSMPRLCNNVILLKMLSRFTQLFEDESAQENPNTCRFIEVLADRLIFTKEREKLDYFS